MSNYRYVPSEELTVKASSLLGEARMLFDELFQAGILVRGNETAGRIDALLNSAHWCLWDQFEED